MHQSPTPDDGLPAPASGPAGTGLLAELAFVGGTETIRDARDRVVELVEPLLDPEHVDSVRLLTSELVSNGLRHGSGTVRLRVSCHDEQVWVAVSDEGDGGRVRLREPGADGPGGYGMHLVEAFAAGWDHDVDGVGTTVRFWFPTVR